MLARIAGTRPRTLETHFRIFLGTTPLGWVRRMRLAQARQELLNAGPQATVTDTAISCGFGQMGRFAAQYRKVFGELPSATIQQARRSSACADQNIDEAIRLTFGVAVCLCGLRLINAMQLSNSLPLLRNWSHPMDCRRRWPAGVGDSAPRTISARRRRPIEFGPSARRRGLSSCPARCLDADAEQRRARAVASTRRSRSAAEQCTGTRSMAGLRVDLSRMDVGLSWR